MAKVTARWLASLSNGETAIEGKEPYNEIEGDKSPFLRLKEDIARRKLEITTIRIQVEIEGLPTRTFNLPSLSQNAKWVNRKPLLPWGFDYFRTVLQDMINTDEGFVRRPEKDEHYIEIHAYYDDFTLATIVSEDTGNESWSLVLPKRA